MDINPFTLRVPLEGIVYYFHTLEKSLRNKAKVHKIFKGELFFDFFSLSHQGRPV